jgi:predicted metal-dependent phosphoesterase TrpH/glycosyltransferase involved in cell wall biosynthesis
MGLRVCLVTPFSWSLPHDVNDHVGGVARELRKLGHTVTVLAPSSRARDLREGRRALQRGELGEVVALGPALPVSRRSTMAAPVGVRANLALALAQGAFDVVHGFEPAVPSLSYLALRDAEAFSVATFFSPDRLFYPPGRAQRARLLGRVDALLATSPVVAAAAHERFPGDYTVVPPGIDTTLFKPGRKRRRIVVELARGERESARKVIRALDYLPGWEVVVVRPARGGRPYVPLRLRPRVHVRTRPGEQQRAELLGAAAIFVPAANGRVRLALEAAAAGAATAGDGAQVVELASRGAEAAAQPAGRVDSFAAVAAQLDAIYRRLVGRRRAIRVDGDPLSDRDWIVCDLHTHTSWSHDCSVPAPALLDTAEAIGLGAIAVTDHNVFGGAREAAELARGRRLTVIPGEEMKTKGQGEVIGLFLHEEIPRGLSFEDTLAAIRAQGGLVFLPHPFDRRHAIPDPATLHRHLAEIDLIEVYNARLLMDSYNDEASRFARKYNLLQGAGSDAHVLPGLGTGAVRMRQFRTPEEFLISLRSAEILRRPKSLAYLQSLKWVAQVKEKVR